MREVLDSVDPRPLPAGNPLHPPVDASRQPQPGEEHSDPPLLPAGDPLHLPVETGQQPQPGEEHAGLLSAGDPRPLPPGEEQAGLLHAGDPRPLPARDPRLGLGVPSGASQDALTGVPSAEEVKVMANFVVMAFRRQTWWLLTLGCLPLWVL